MNLPLFDDISLISEYECLVEEERTNAKRAAVIKRKNRLITRRAKSEAVLAEVIKEPFEQGNSYHVISHGDVDSLSFIPLILRQLPLDYLLFSTWVMSMTDIEMIKAWCETGKIGTVDAYLGEIFPTQYPDEYATLREFVPMTGGRLVYCRNHSKVMAGFNEDEQFWFVLESSANINTNPRIEQSSLHCDHELFNFYKDFFDGIKSY